MSQILSFHYKFHLKSYINFSLYRVNGDQFGLATVVAFMGAPSDANEDLISGQELTQCLQVMQNIIASGKELE